MSFSMFEHGSMYSPLPTGPCTLMCLLYLVLKMKSVDIPS